MPDPTLDNDGGSLPEITTNKAVFMLLKDRRMKLRLLEALRIRNFDILTRVLADTRDGEYIDRMKQEYDDAKVLHEHLAKITLLQKDISNLSRNRFSEIQGYTRPPDTLQKLMKVIFILLGENSNDLTWSKIRGLLYRSDRQSVLGRVGRFNINNVTPESITEASDLMRDVKKHDVELISNVATLFFVWATYVLRASRHIIRIKKEYFQREMEVESKRNKTYSRMENTKNIYRNKRLSERNMSQEEDELTVLRIRDNIRKITRAQLSELQAYGHPPVTIQRVMRATYAVLGENPAELEWRKIRYLMNKSDHNSILKRIGNFQINDLQSGSKEYAQETLDGLTLHDVKSVSTAAALFYLWVKSVIREAENPRKWNNVGTFIKDADEEQNNADGYERPRIESKENRSIQGNQGQDILVFQNEITKMTRVRITEVHSYSNPPEVVEKVMKAIYIILGEPLTNLTWKKLRGLMSRMDKNSLTKRIENFQVTNLTAEAARIAVQFLDELTFQKVQTVSNVAATFYAWAKYILNTWKNKTTSVVDISQTSQSQMSDQLTDRIAEEGEEDMSRIRAEITKMSRGRISEIHAYARPPAIIEKVMKAVFTILGESPGGLDWKKIRGLMCRMDRNSLIRRVEGFQINELSRDTAQMADFVLSDLTLQSVKSVSSVAATLYAWAKCIVKDVDHLSEMAEAKKKEEASKIRPESSLSQITVSQTSSDERFMRRSHASIVTFQDNFRKEPIVPILTKAQILRITSKRRRQQSSPDSDSSSKKENKRPFSENIIEETAADGE